jgi:predicted nucleotidyltransferase
LSSKIQHLTGRQFIKPPKWLPDNVHYETVMGSIAYGVNDDDSDFDVYGWCIPPKDMVFPHLRGEIPGFGRQVQRFEQYQQHHIQDPEARAGKGRMYDLQIYSIVKFFHLAMENNPNMVDALFTPANAVLHATQIAQRVREQRRIFLHKGSWHKFKGYAYSQLQKMRGDRERPEGKRRAIVEQHGYDVKFAYHVVRLIDEVEQILETGDLELGRNREQMKAIRRGEWTEDQVRQYFTDKERQLEELYHRSSIPHSPDEERIKRLLLECLEEHYGSLAAVVVLPDASRQALTEIQAILDRFPGLSCQGGQA